MIVIEAFSEMVDRELGKAVVISGVQRGAGGWSFPVHKLF